MLTHKLETLPEQARRLSSGTIGSLCGKTLYSEIEAVQLEFTEFCEENEAMYETWPTAWNAFVLVKESMGQPVIDTRTTCGECGADLSCGHYRICSQSD